MAKAPIKAVAAALSAIAASILAVEGGYVNNPADPGGATNHGVTERVARANGYAGDMRALPKERAIDILVRQYVTEPGFMPIVERSEPVAREVIDSGYNAGPARPARWLQVALNALNDRGRLYANIPVDGRVGPATIAALDAFLARRGAKGCEVLVKALDAQQGAHYLALANADSQFETFAFGWFDHRIGNVDLKTCKRIPA